MDDFNPYAPPSVSTDWGQPHEELTSAEIVRDGKRLLLPPHSRLPHRCVVCNGAEATEHQLTVIPLEGSSTRWYSIVSAIAVVFVIMLARAQGLVTSTLTFVALVLAGSLLTLLLTRGTRQNDPESTQPFSLCRNHQYRQWIRATIGMGVWALILLPRVTSWFQMPGLSYSMLLIILVIASSVLRLRLQAQRLESGHVEVRGCGRLFLISFPDISER